MHLRLRAICSERRGFAELSCLAKHKDFINADIVLAMPLINFQTSNLFAALFSSLTGIRQTALTAVA